MKRIDLLFATIMIAVVLMVTIQLKKMDKKIYKEKIRVARIIELYKKKESLKSDKVNLENKIKFTKQTIEELEPYE